MIVLDKSTDSFIIRCDKCNKLLEDDDTLMAEYRELVIMKINVKTPFAYKSEHEVKLHLCNECVDIVKNAIEKAVKEDKENVLI